MAAAAAIVACGPRKTAVQTPSAQEFAEYVKAYTGGIVADDAVIRIDLAQEARQQPTEGLFTIQPKVQGTTQWATPTTVTFTPESLEAGQTYTISFALDQVLPDASAWPSAARVNRPRKPANPTTAAPSR